MRHWIQSAAVMVLALSSAVRAATPICILPLGDSITAGSDGGYRKPLMQALGDTYHLAVTSVGSQTDASLPVGQQAHEGHPGWRLDQLNENLMGRKAGDLHAGYWLQGGHDTSRGPIAPTIVTLMAGINDLNQMLDDPDAKARAAGHARPMSDRSDEILATLQSRFRAIVTTLDGNLPDATLFLGGCIPYNNGLLDEKLTGATEAHRKQWGDADGVSPQQEMGVNHWVILFNQWIRDTYVPELQKAGKKVEYVDVYAKFILPDGSVRGWNNKPPEDTRGPAAYGDYGLHPNAFGYGLMAEAWATAIAARADKPAAIAH